MWIHVPSECFPCSPESPASDSELKSLYQTLATCATWRGSLRPAKSWERAWPKGRLTQHRSLRILPTSMAARGVEAWILSKADSPAWISALQESSAASPANVPDSGSSTCELFARFNQHSSLLKTSHQFSLFQQEEPYLEGLPKSGSMRNGLLYRLPAWEPAIEDPEFLSWPTARAEDAESCGNHPDAMDSLTGAVRQWQTPATDSFRSRGGDRRDEMGLDQQARFWTTPHGMGNRDATGKIGGAGGGEFAKQVNQWRTPDAPGQGGPRNRQSSVGHGHQVTIAEQAERWGTPTSRDWKDGASPDNRAGRGDNGLVSLQVLNWPTPNVPNGGRTSNTTSTREDGSKRQVDLGALAKNWLTPATSDTNGTRTLDGKRSGGLNTQAAIAFPSSPPDQEIPTSGANCWCGSPGCDLPSHKRKLNPIFATWLMGWPLYWVTKEPMPFARSEMASWLCNVRSRLSCLLSERG